MLRKHRLIFVISPVSKHAGVLFYFTPLVVSLVYQFPNSIKISKKVLGQSLLRRSGIIHDGMLQISPFGFLQPELGQDKLLFFGPLIIQLLRCQRHQVAICHDGPIGLRGSLSPQTFFKSKYNTTFKKEKQCNLNILEFLG